MPIEDTKALYEAIRSRDVAAVRSLLLQRTTAPLGEFRNTYPKEKTKPGPGMTPVQIAGFPILVVPTRDGTSLLHVAAEHAMRDHGVIEESASGEAILGSRMTAIAALLLDAGLEVDARDGSGATPLHVAVRSQCLPLATLLIERGADAQALDVFGRTAIDGCTASTYPSLFGYLLAHGAHPDGGPRRLGQDTLLESLSWDGAHDLLVLALDAGADLKRHPKALPCACARGHDDVALLLLSRGADPTEALPQVALSNGEDVRFLKLLVEHGAKATGPHLFDLARQGAHVRLRALFQLGADPHFTGGGGTLFDVASKAYAAGNAEARHVKQLLREVGAGPKQSAPTAAPLPVAASTPQPVPPPQTQLGARVTHAKFGEGVITKVDRETFDITFDNGEQKSLLARFVRLL